LIGARPGELTNSSVSPAFYERLFGEIFGEYVGVRPPVLAPPEHIHIDADLERHTGRYERTSARYDVSLGGGNLHVLPQPTGEAATFDEESQDLCRASAQQPLVRRRPIASADRARGRLCRTRSHCPELPSTTGAATRKSCHAYGSACL
jgi:hypothetical protein